MQQTRYHRPQSLDEAARLFSESSEARYLSGGQTLIPTMKQRLASPSDVIDLSRLAELKGIAVANGTLAIGAATTHAEVATSEEVRKAIPALARLAGLIGDPAVRHKGTIGGSLANNDPAADYPAAALALKATIHTNRRAVSADDFFRGLFATALDEGEILTRVVFPIPTKAAYAKFDHPASRYALAAAFVAVAPADGVRVAVTGAGAKGVFRATEIERALAARFAAEALDGILVDPSGLISDMHGSAGYRANLVKVMAARAVASLAA